MTNVVSDPELEPSRPIIYRRRPRVPRGTPGSGRRRTFNAPDDTWQQALDACHERGVTLGSQLVRALERIAAGETL